MNVTVESVKKLKDKGDASVYLVTCKQEDGSTIEAERFTKFAAPSAGEKGTIEQSEYGPKYVPANKGGGGGRRGGAPEERRSIEAQVALKAAVAWGTVLAEKGERVLSTDDLVGLTNKFKGVLRDG